MKMKNENSQLNVIKDRKLLTGFILSFMAHIFLFTGIPNEQNKLLGDKYIPIQVINLNTLATKGDSIIKSQNKKNNLENNLEEQKRNNKIDEELKEEDLKNNLLNQSNTDAENNSFSPENTLNEKSVESEEKIFGTKKGLKKENVESGSIKGTGIEKITCLKCLEPIYPKLAIKKGYEGTLKLKITISKNGSVKDVLIKESTGYNILDKSGIDAAKNSKFYPLSKETKLDIEYRLELN